MKIWEALKLAGRKFREFFIRTYFDGPTDPKGENRNPPQTTEESAQRDGKTP